MKIKLDIRAVESKAKQKGVAKLSILCRRAGVSYSTIRNCVSRGGGVSIETAWLLSEYLDCSINEIVSPDWKL